MLPLAAIVFLILYAVYIVPAMLGVQAWIRFVNYINSLCYKHPELIAKSTISALVGMLFAYFFHSNLIVVIEYAGNGFLVGVVLHLLSLIFKG